MLNFVETQRKDHLKVVLITYLISKLTIDPFASEDTFGLEKFAKVGGTMSEFKEVVSPFTQLGESIISRMDSPLAGLDKFTEGMKMPSL